MLDTQPPLWHIRQLVVSNNDAAEAKHDEI